MSLRTLLVRLLLPRRRAPAPYVMLPTPAGRDMRPLVRQAVANVARERLSGIHLQWNHRCVEAPGPAIPEGMASIIFYSICVLYTHCHYSRDEIDAAVIEMLDHLE